MEVPIIQVVGFQNSGKTTLIQKCIQHFSAKDLSVAVLKHHGHGTEPDINSSKDSVGHFQTGAIASLVEGAGVFQLLGRLEELSIDRKIQLLQFFNPKAIFVEGYKSENYPKIILIRNVLEYPSLKGLTNVVAVIYWPKMEQLVMNSFSSIPKFSLNDEEIFSWIDRLIESNTSIHEVG